MAAGRHLALSIVGLLFLCIVCECIEQRRVYSRKPQKQPLKQTYSYATKYFQQPVDHFGYTSKDMFLMRYLYNDSYWDTNGGPIFFYTGNEGDIEVFCENTGFMWDIAPQFKALIVFAEHRYYGKSMPYGNDSYKDPAHLGFLTSEQALADYAVFIQWIKSGKWGGKPGAQNSPVIVFGGSYGGMLAAWFRMKYPHLADGAIAASAPIWQFEGFTPCEVYNQIVTGDFRRYGDTCVENVRASWAAIDAVAAKGDAGLQYLSSTFRTCSPLKTKADVDTLKGFISNAWGNIAMVEYPYATNFLNPLPAWPIGEVCKQLSQPYQGSDLVAATYNAVNIFYNYTGQVQDCYDILEPPGPIGDDGWNYQACTEMVMPMCSDNKNDFFSPMKWDLDAYDVQCTATYSVIPQPYWVMTNYFGLDVKQASNIVFSNGLLDPWHGGGVLQSQSDTVVAVIISEGAHHLDLRASNPADPPSVRAARQLECSHIEKWIAEKRMRANQA